MSCTVGERSNQTLNDLRYQLFTKAAAKTSFNLARLPPTQDAAKLHSFRTYHQVQQWLGYKKNPLEWKWVDTARGFSPKMVSREASSPLKPSCKKGCSNACSCRKAGLKCSVVCGSCNGQSCENLPEITIDVDVNTHDLDELDDDELDRLLDYPVSQLAGDAIEQVEKQNQVYLHSYYCFLLINAYLQVIDTIISIN